VLMQFFDHQAWRRPFNPWTPIDNYDRFEDALSRTKKGIATGRFESREGDLVNEGVARRGLRDRELRAALEEVVAKLDELEVLVARCRAAPAESGQEVIDIKRLRTEIVQAINQQAERRGLEPLPLPASGAHDGVSPTTAG
jgi:hypothetical protein